MIYEIVMATGDKFFTNELPTVRPEMTVTAACGQRLAVAAAKALHRGEGKTVHLNGRRVEYVIEHDDV